jgi:COP9 signalosome complex subunit 1
MSSKEDLLSSLQGYDTWQRLTALLMIMNNDSATRDIAQSILFEELLRENCTGFLKAHTNDGTFTSNQLSELVPWEQRVDQHLSPESSGLESRLLNAKSSTIKEAIRQCHIDFGDFLRRWGKLDDSSKQYLKARDFCSTPQHQVECCFRLISINFEMQNYQAARSFTSKIFDISTDHTVRSKASAFEGILQTMAGHFRSATESFLSIGHQLDDQSLGTVLLSDVALCGGLCILATSNRADILKTFSSSNTFIKHILLHQPALRSMILEYANGKFSNCISFVESLQSTKMKSNIFLREISQSILKAISEKVVFQYLLPYEVISMDDVATSLQVSGEFVEKFVAILINKKLLVAKIDLEKRVIIKSSVNVAAKIVEEALQLTSSHVFAVERNFIHSSMLRQSMSNTEGGSGKSSNKRMAESGLSSADAMEMEEEHYY